MHGVFPHRPHRRPPMHRSTFRRAAASALATTAVLGAATGVAAAADLTVNEHDGTASATVTVASPSLVPRMIQYWTVDDTASAGSDYTPVPATPPTTTPFAPLQISKTVDIGIVDDNVPEGDETFHVRTNAGDQAITVVDDDPSPTASIGDAAVNEKDGTARLAVSLSGPSGLPITVDYETGDDTAKAGADYSAGSGSLTFAPGETTRTVSVAVANDGAHEDSERFFVRLVHASNAGIGDKEGVVTIGDDDAAATPAPAAPKPAQQQQQNNIGSAHVGPGLRFGAVTRVAFVGWTKDRRAKIRVWCPRGGGLCSGSFSLKAGGRKIGKGDFLIPSHSSRVVKVKLTRAARRAIRRHHRLRVVARLDAGRVARLTLRG